MGYGYLLPLYLQELIVTGTAVTGTGLTTVATNAFGESAVDQSTVGQASVATTALLHDVVANALTVTTAVAAAETRVSTLTTVDSTELATAGAIAYVVSSDTPPIPPEIDLMTAAFIIVTGVGECVVSELADTEGGIPDRVCLVVPGSIAWDNCECGQFAQTITSVAPSAQFPSPATDTPQATCAAPLAVVSVTMSLTRCVPGVSDRGFAPTCHDLLIAARVLEDDRATLRRALNCCLRDKLDGYQILNYSIGAATSVGPDGGCAGVELSYQFALSNECCR